MKLYRCAKRGDNKLLLDADATSTGTSGPTFDITVMLHAVEVEDYHYLLELTPAQARNLANSLYRYADLAEK